MPRPKVPPSQRRRAAEACNFCRASKKRCSATVPCTACVRRGHALSCSLTHKPRGASGARAPEPVVRGPSGSSGATSRLVSPLSPPDVAETADVAADATEPATGTGTASPLGKAPHPRMLLNSNGERVYIGKAASLSFLQVVRDMVAEQIGPSRFSHNEQSDRMLEKSYSSAANADKLLVSAAVGLDADQKRLYAQCFQSVTGGLLDVFSPLEVEALLMLGPSPGDLQINHCKRATIDLIIGIGAQTHSLTSAQTVGQAHARQAQEHALAGMLEDPSVDMVRAFLLLAFYMLGECRRNAAYMYLGVAARAAIALGLHSRASYTGNHPKYQLRLRIWISLCVLDMLVSAILSRPAATNHALRAGLERHINDMNDENQDRDTGTACLVAAYKILAITMDIVETLYSKTAMKENLSSGHVEQCLDKIEAWSRSLPDTVRRAATTPPTTTPGDRLTMGSIHVSCLYYFAVTLATRPILIAVLAGPPGASNNNSQNPQQQLASACLDAAVFLVQTCVDALRARLLLGNMCIMKALVFAAGLILGFELFSKQREMDFQVEAAFRGAQDVLGFLAPQSPQAAHYLEILGLLASAIAKQRETLAVRSRSKYVGRIFSLGGQNSGSDDATEAAIITAVSRDNTMPTRVLPTDAPADPPADAEGNGQPFLGWDSLDLMQWDSFPFLSPRSFDLAS
ncbi:hypothetical protein SEUCBS139899_005768 [Sporothrix eucalyptigena]